MPSPILQEVHDTVNQSRTVMQSASALVRSIPTLIANAKAEALANGASAEELAPFDTLADALRADADTLAADVLAHTPQQPTA